MPNQEILNQGWAQLCKEIDKGDIPFRPDAFRAFSLAFAHLYPCFGHGTLWFSTSIEASDNNFSSPLIVCKGRTIEISAGLDDFLSGHAFKTEDIPTAVNEIRALLPAGLARAIP